MSRLILREEPTAPCAVVLGRWDPERGPVVFPSKRSRATRRVVIFETVEDVRRDLAEVDDVLAMPNMKGDTFLVAFAPPGEVQATIDRVARELERAATTEDAASRGFDEATARRLGFPVAGPEEETL